MTDEDALAIRWSYDRAITELVFEHLAALDCSLARVCREAGLTPNEVSQAMNGRRHWSVRTLIRVADHMDLELGDLLREASFRRHPPPPDPELA